MKYLRELSIVIPCKNEEQYIGALLESLTRQMYDMRRTRIFIADAGSTDKTLGVIRKYKHKLPITIIKGGLPAAGRNAGARKCRTKYILFIDADVILDDSTLIERAVSLMQEKNLQCVTTSILCNKRDARASVLYFLNNIAQRISKYMEPFATGMFILVRRDVFKKLGGFDERILYAEDYALTKQIPGNRFEIVSGNVLTTNRRFKKIGYWKAIKLFVGTTIHRNDAQYFYTDKGYWK